MAFNDFLCVYYVIFCFDESSFASFTFIHLFYNISSVDSRPKKSQCFISPLLSLILMLNLFPDWPVGDSSSSFSPLLIEPPVSL